MTGGLIALTFDDGPDPEITPQLLDVLEKYHVPASFFLIGERITAETVPILQRAVMLGCELDHHSYSHPYMTVLSPRQIEHEIFSATQRIILSTGQTPLFFRPPYFAVTEALFSQVNMPFIGGYGVRDYDANVSEAERYQGVMRLARDGRIILLHDFEGNAPTVAARPRHARQRLPLCHGLGAVPGKGHHAAQYRPHPVFLHRTDGNVCAGHITKTNGEVPPHRAEPLRFSGYETGRQPKPSACLSFVQIRSELSRPPRSRSFW